MIILDLTILNILDCSDVENLKAYIKYIKDAAEKDCGQQIVSARIGEEFCSKKCMIFNKLLVDNLILACHLCNLHNIELVLPPLYENDLKEMIALLDYALKTDQIYCIILNNWGLIEYAKKFKKKIGIGRLLPVTNISLNSSKPLLNTKQAIEYKLRLLNKYNCSFGDLNISFLETDLNMLTNKRVRIYYPYLYITSMRQCLWSFCDNKVKIPSCFMECKDKIMISRSDKWNYDICQIGNAQYFKPFLYIKNANFFNNIDIIYTAIDCLKQMVVNL